MKKTLAFVFGGLLTAAVLLWGGCKSSIFAEASDSVADSPKTALFETAIGIIKKYETIHKPKHWPFVGYGHKVLPGEKFSRTKTLSEADADALLRKDMKTLCAMYRPYGKDSLILATLAYNIGHGAVNRSSIVQNLKEGNRDIHDTYVAYCRYRGKVHAGIQRRRNEEYDNLFVTEEEAEDEERPLLSRPFMSESCERLRTPRLTAALKGRYPYIAILLPQPEETTL